MSDHGTGPEPADGRLARIAAQLDEIEQAPLDQRPALFESVNRALVEELTAMETD